MSGTSLDGIDAGLVDFSDGKTRLVAFHYTPFNSELRERIQHLSQPGQTITLSDYGHLDSELGQLFAQATLDLLAKADLSANEVAAIGSHGQTIYHDPTSPLGFSLQIGDPNYIVQLTGITTVADFRRRDIAAGGQGAPLVPGFHRAVFGANTPCVVVNIGGIANITILDDITSGFDTGPGNTLLDYWCQQHTQAIYDINGDWGASGEVNLVLLECLKDDNYFRQPPPKSTGKEYFSIDWLRRKLLGFVHLPPQDIQATLCELTAVSIANAIDCHATNCQQVLVCGGGAHNRQLMARLETNLGRSVNSTKSQGISPDHVEAIAFAWLARATLNGQPGNLTEVTGASEPVILGGIYPGKAGLRRER